MLRFPEKKGIFSTNVNGEVSRDEISISRTMELTGARPPRPLHDDNHMESIVEWHSRLSPHQEATLRLHSIDRIPSIACEIGRAHV